MTEKRRAGFFLDAALMQPEQAAGSRQPRNLTPQLSQLSRALEMINNRKFRMVLALLAISSVRLNPSGFMRLAPSSSHAPSAA
jgi:hypothetical protein